MEGGAGDRGAVLRVTAAGPESERRLLHAEETPRLEHSEAAPTSSRLLVGERRQGGQGGALRVRRRGVQTLTDKLDRQRFLEGRLVAGKVVRPKRGARGREIGREAGRNGAAVEGRRSVGGDSLDGQGELGVWKPRSKRAQTGRPVKGREGRELGRQRRVVGARQEPLEHEVHRNASPRQSRGWPEEIP